jgi:hypothetical protein
LRLRHHRERRSELTTGTKSSGRRPVCSACHVRRLVGSN